MIVESTLKTLQKSAAYGSMTDIAEVVCLLAPYLDPEGLQRQGGPVPAALPLCRPLPVTRWRTVAANSGKRDVSIMAPVYEIETELEQMYSAQLARML
jgi:hypothetical protein